MSGQKEKASLCKSKITKILIKKLKGLYDLEIDFDKPLTAIMGVNGIGRSTGNINSRDTGYYYKDK